MLLSVQRSRIFTEFSVDEQKYWFGIKEKAVAHHVDTLYYTVSIRGDDVQMTNAVIAELVSDLGELKEAKKQNPSESIQFFGLEVSSVGGSAIYIYRLQMPELYDIFFAKNTANNQTPRIQVQLRTHSLVMNGLYNALEDSFAKIKEILEGYNLDCHLVLETRVDDAFHTNVVQNAYEYFGTDKLNQHLVSCFSRYGIEGSVPHRIDEDIDLDYFYLGRRAANYLFFRVYEKTKEVVQMNYKGFFFEKWFQRGLISRYDKYVYEYAYKIASFNTGVLVGKIKWYLEYGKDSALKLELTDLLDKYNVNSSNNRELESRIKGLLPPVTKVYNFEFESKRKFYTFYDKFIDSQEIELAEGASPELIRIYRVLALRRFFVDIFLTDYVSFVDNRRNIDRLELDWWRRIRCCRLDCGEDEQKLSAIREYSRNLDLARQKRKFFGSVANFHIFKRKAVEFDSGFGEDICDAISFLNDNDVHRESMAELVKCDPFGYREVKKQRWRQLAPVLKKIAKKEEAIEAKAASFFEKPYDEIKYFYEDLEDNSKIPAAEANPVYKSDEWRCIHCDNVYSGEKELTQFVGQTTLPPYRQGICRKCLKLYRELKS